MTDGSPTGPGWPVRLATHLWNPGGTAGRALLLHGLGSDGKTWWRLASHLADLGYLVAAPDLRSHGDSPTAVDHRVATLADDAAMVGDGWDLIVGHSLGGAIAAELLARDDVDIGAAVLLDPVLLLRAAVRDPVRRKLREDVGPDLSRASIATGHPRWDDRDVEVKLLAATRVAPSTVDAVIDQNDPWDLRQAIGRWRVPVHVVAADPALDELQVGPLVGDEVLAALAGQDHVVAVVVPGAGHSVHRDDFDAVWSVVQRVVAVS